MKKIVYAAIAAIVLLSFVFPMNVSARKKEIGFQIYSVMGAAKENPEATIKQLSKMGYTYLELVQWGGDPKVLGVPAADFKAMCDKYGMGIVSTHSSIQDDPTKEEEIMNRWRSLFEIQKSLGGSYFVIPSYKVDYTTAEVQKMCDYFNRVGKLASEYGLKLGYHNHNREFSKLKDSDQLMWDYLVQHTDPQYVCFELDVYWCTKGGQDPVALLKKYPNRIQLLHIKDELVIGESGEIDFENIFKQFYANGYSTFFTEIETPRAMFDKVRKGGDEAKAAQEEINEFMLDASKKSAKYQKKASFVK